MHCAGSIADQIGGLPIVARVPLENAAIRTDDGRAQRVSDQATLLRDRQAKEAGDTGKLSGAGRGELPVIEERGLLSAGAGVAILAKHRRSVVLGIDTDAEQASLAIELGVAAKVPVDLGKFAADARTIVRERDTVCR